MVAVCMQVLMAMAKVAADLIAAATEIAAPKSIRKVSAMRSKVLSLKRMTHFLTNLTSQRPLPLPLKVLPL